MEANREQIVSKGKTISLLEMLTRPWTLLIMSVIAKRGPTRFGRLRRVVQGISARILTERLRFLEESGFVYREYKPTIPPEVTYGSTSKLRELEKVLDEFSHLAKKWEGTARTSSPARPHARSATGVVKKT